MNNQKVYILKFGKVKKNEPSVSSPSNSQNVSPSNSQKGLKGYIKNNPKKVGGALALLTAGTAAAIASRKKDKKVTFTINTTPGNLKQNEEFAPEVTSHPLDNYAIEFAQIIVNDSDTEPLLQSKQASLRLLLKKVKNNDSLTQQIQQKLKQVSILLGRKQRKYKFGKFRKFRKFRKIKNDIKMLQNMKF